MNSALQIRSRTVLMLLMAYTVLTLTLSDLNKPRQSTSRSCGNVWLSATKSVSFLMINYKPMRALVRTGLIVWCLIEALFPCQSLVSQQSGASGALPVGLEVCDNACMTPDNHVLVQHWTFDGMQGRSKWNTSDQTMSTLTVERFDSERVVIRRADLPGTPLAGITYVYEGTWKNGRLEGSATGTWSRIADKKNPTGSFSITWYATVPVTTCSATGHDAVEIGTTAIKYQQFSSAFHCFELAAKLGDGTSKGIVGLMYRDGIGTTVNYSEAFRWLKAGAIQGEYNCQLALSQMYAVGIGTAPDQHLADVWKEQAANNPVILRQKAQAQAESETRALVFEGLAAVIEAAVSPTVYVRAW